MRGFLSEPFEPLYARVEPWQAALGTLLLGWGTFMLIWWFIEGHHHFPRWASFNFGDSIGFPLFAFFAAEALHGYKPTDDWYNQRWMVGAFMLVGFAIAARNLQDGRHTRALTWKDILAPSEIYHTVVIFPVMTLAICQSLILMFFVMDVAWSTRLFAMAGFAIFAVGLIYDMSPLQDRGPGR